MRTESDLGTKGDLYTGAIRFKLIGDNSDIQEIRVSPGDAHGGADQQIIEDLMECTGKSLPASCFRGDELFPSIITALGLEQAKQKGTVVDLEPQWKQLGL